MVAGSPGFEVAMLEQEMRAESGHRSREIISGPCSDILSSWVWAETRLQRQTVCQHLECGLSIRSVKSKSENTVGARSRGRVKELHLERHLGILPRLGLRILAVGGRVTSFQYRIWLLGKKQFVLFFFFK